MNSLARDRNQEYIIKEDMIIKRNVFFFVLLDSVVTYITVLIPFLCQLLICGNFDVFCGHFVVQSSCCTGGVNFLSCYFVVVILLSYQL